MWDSISKWLYGNQPSGSMANITGTEHIVPDAMKFDSIDSLMGNLNFNGDQTMLNVPTQNSGFLNNYGGLALGALQGAGNLFMGMKQYGMAKDALNEGKRQFNVNFDAQKKMTNSRLEDRQRARVAADPNAHQGVDDYMKRYGVN